MDGETGYFAKALSIHLDKCSSGFQHIFSFPEKKRLQYFERSVGVWVTAR